MTNLEKHKGEIFEVLKKANNLAVTKEGKVAACFDIPCTECQFATKRCRSAWKEWVNTEYVEPKTFTNAEKAIIKSCEKIKYVARDRDGDLYFYSSEPMYNNDAGFWAHAPNTPASTITSEPFDAVKSNDKIPTSREEILNSEVKDD